MHCLFNHDTAAAQLKNLNTIIPIHYRDKPQTKETVHAKEQEIFHNISMQLKKFYFQIVRLLFVFSPFSLFSLTKVKTEVRIKAYGYGSLSEKGVRYANFKKHPKSYLAVKKVIQQSLATKFNFSRYFYIRTNLILVLGNHSDG